MNTSDKISISFITFEENGKNPAPDGQFVQKRPLRTADPDQPEQGAPRPLFPCGRDFIPAPNGRSTIWTKQTCFRMKLQEAMCTHGRNENTKNGEGENLFSLSPFSVFSPDAKASGRRRSAAQPVGGWQCHLQLAKALSSSANLLLRAADNPASFSGILFVSYAKQLPLLGAGPMALLG